MTRRIISLILLLAIALFGAACGPEAKKKRAIEGGNKYFDKGQYKQARLMYLNAVKADPRFGEAYYKLALTNMRLGSYGEALGNLQRAVELQPDNLDALSRLSDIYVTSYASNPVKYKDLMGEIKDLAARLEKRGKGSYEELRLKGFIHLADNKVEEALALFLEADKKRPGQAVLQLTIARTMLAMKKFDEADAYLRAALAKNPAFTGAYDVLYGAALAQNKLDVAEKVLQDRVKANPKDVSNHLRLAAHFYVTKKPDEIEKVLAGIIANRAQFSNAFVDVGDFHYRVRDYDRAASTYSDGLKQDAERKLVYQKRLVEVRVAQNRAGEALDLCETILKENPKDPEVIAMRASLWLYAGKPDQINTAISELQSVVTKMPDNFVLRYNLGRALMAKGDLDGARVQFVDALQYRSDYIPARLALAQILATRGEHAAALSAANEILQLDPGNQFARLIKSHTYMSQGKFDDSKAILEETIKLFPNQRDAKYQMGYVLFREGKLKEAEGHFRAIYAQNPPDIRGLMGLTEIYAANKNIDAALQLLDEAIQKYPKATALKVAWGNIAVRGGRLDDGINMFRKVLADDPKNFDLHMRIAESYRQKGEIPKAIEFWKVAGDLMPNVIAPLVNRALALEQLSRRTEAAPLYEQILKAEPDNVVVLNNYSYYLADHGNNLDLALTYAQKAKSKAPNDPMIADTLGFIYLKKNLPLSAAPIFTELVNKHPKVALFHIRLATAYLQAGDRPKARQSLAEARKNNPSKSDMEEINALAGKIG